LVASTPTMAANMSNEQICTAGLSLALDKKTTWDQDTSGFGKACIAVIKRL
jgi:hypothetical protein